MVDIVSQVGWLTERMVAMAHQINVETEREVSGQVMYTDLDARDDPNVNGISDSGVVTRAVQPASSLLTSEEYHILYEDVLNCVDEEVIECLP